MHLDPSIYLMDDDSKLPTKDEESKPSKGDGKNDIQTANSSTISLGSQGENNDGYCGNVRSGEETVTDQLNKVTGLLESIDVLGTNPEKKGYC